MASNQEQMSQNVNYHKRIAMGASLDGSTLGSKDAPKSSAPAKSGTGALAQAKKK
jgi:hypothetical protein